MSTTHLLSSPCGSRTSLTQIAARDRTMHFPWVIFLVLSAMLVVQPLNRPAASQTLEVPSDSVPADTGRRDTARVGNPHHPLMLPALVALGAVMLFAPSTIVLMNPVRDTVRPGFMDNHVSVYLTGGVGGFDEPDQAGGAHSQSIEFLQNGVYGELRVENFHLPDHTQRQALRVGYLIHPNDAMAGGITLGYRRAPGGGFRQGVEIGFPLLWGTRSGWARIDATYVIASFAADWHWRIQGGFPLSVKPFIAGLSMEFTGPPRWRLAEGPPANGMLLSLLFGMRL
ncbi:MAG TPA: hypothetical protein VGR37_02890 [Longimicrobiaceae bacterium]|nr:hypothetical protein [Longimicrobiaceae bacterium]